MIPGNGSSRRHPGEPRIGVVGACALGSHHIRLLRALPGVRFAGFFEARADRAKTVASELRVDAATSLDELLGPARERRRPRMLKAIAIRKNALNRLHREQISLLRSSRSGGGEKDFEALLVTVNAIAAGLKTTG